MGGRTAPNGQQQRSAQTLQLSYLYNILWNIASPLKTGKDIFLLDDPPLRKELCFWEGSQASTVCPYQQRCV